MTGQVKNAAGFESGGRREEYAAERVRRWQDYTGWKALLDHDGRSFQLIADGDLQPLQTFCSPALVKSG
jgi:hypothetical protein